jgi:hypothetical protein
MIQILWIKQHDGGIEYEYIDFTDYKPRRLVKFIKTSTSE